MVSARVKLFAVASYLQWVILGTMYSFVVWVYTAVKVPLEKTQLQSNLVASFIYIGAAAVGPLWGVAVGASRRRFVASTLLSPTLCAFSFAMLYLTCKPGSNLPQDTGLLCLYTMIMGTTVGVSYATVLGQLQFQWPKRTHPLLIGLASVFFTSGGLAAVTFLWQADGDAAERAAHLFRAMAVLHSCVGIPLAAVQVWCTATDLSYVAPPGEGEDAPCEEPLLEEAGTLSPPTDSWRVILRSVSLFLVLGVVSMKLIVGSVFMSNLGELSSSLYADGHTAHQQAQFAAKAGFVATVAQLVGRIIFAVVAGVQTRLLGWVTERNPLAPVLRAGLLIKREHDVTMMMAFLLSLAFTAAGAVAVHNLTSSNLTALTWTVAAAYGCMWSVNGALIGYIDGCAASPRGFVRGMGLVNPAAAFFGLIANLIVGYSVGHGCTDSSCYAAANRGLFAISVALFFLLVALTYNIQRRRKALRN